MNDDVYRLANGLEKWQIWRLKNPDIKVDLSNIHLSEEVSDKQLTVLSMNITPVISAIFSLIFAAICFFYNFQDVFDIENIENVGLLILIGLASAAIAILLRFTVF